MTRNLDAPPWSLRPYQREAIRAVSTAWQERDRTMLVMATGTGKTTVFAEVLRRRAMAGRGRALVLAHRIELLTQARDRLQLGGLGAHIESGDSLAPLHPLLSTDPADVVVATVQTMRGRRLERWAPDSFSTIIVDEAHHVTAAAYRAVLDRFPAAKILGVTATPDRGDNVAVGNVIDHLAFSYDLRQGIADGYLSKLLVGSFGAVAIDMTSVRTTKQEHGRDLNPSDLANAMRGEQQLHELAIPIARDSGTRPTLVFVPTVEIAHELARVLAAYVGADQVDSLDGSSSVDERQTALRRYQSGACRILVNCALFTEGFDAPATSCVAIARPTKSRALYAQMVGRGTRLSPETGKTDCLILNLASDAHDLVTPIDLLAGDDLDDDIRKGMRGAMDGDDVMEVLARGEALAKRRADVRERERQQAHVIAAAKYRMVTRDPFAELGIDTSPKDESGPRATEPMIAAITRSGLMLDKVPSVKEAKKILDELTNRRRRGLCTIKQARLLRTKGLRDDLSFDEARDAMNLLAGNDWRVSAELAERFGAPV
jgi:superfamily II DNA or RNA helicase